MGRAIPVSQVPAYWGNLGKLGSNTPNHVQGHKKNNPSLQLLVSHQMRPCCSARALCELSYTCFTATWVLGQFGKLALNTPNHVQGHKKNNPKSSGSCFTSSVRAFCGLSYTCFSGTWALRQFGETGSKYPKSCAGTQEK